MGVKMLNTVRLLVLGLVFFCCDLRAADLSGDVGVTGVSGVQWRVIDGHGIWICADGQVWLASGQCSNRPIVPGEAVPSFPSKGVSPAQYIEHYFGHGAKLVDLSVQPPYGDQPPILELVYTLGNKDKER